MMSLSILIFAANSWTVIFGVSRNCFSIFFQFSPVGRYSLFGLPDFLGRGPLPWPRGRALPAIDL